MRKHAVLLSLLSVVLLPTPGLAQARGQVGLTMGFPTAAGLTWHATDRIAIRPSVTFLQLTAKADSTPPTVSSESTNRALGLGIGLLWYIGPSGRDVRPYVSPAFAYNRATTSGTDRDPVESVTVSGAFGTQYTPTPRLGVYGEVGLARAQTDRTQRFPPLMVAISETTWSIRSAVGVIFYLGS